MILRHRTNGSWIRRSSVTSRITSIASVHLNHLCCRIPVASASANVRWWFRKILSPTKIQTGNNTVISSNIFSQHRSKPNVLHGIFCFKFCRINKYKYTFQKRWKKGKWWLLAVSGPFCWLLSLFLLLSHSARGKAHHPYYGNQASALHVLSDPLVTRKKSPFINDPSGHNMDKVIITIRNKIPSPWLREGVQKKSIFFRK